MKPNATTCLLSCSLAALAFAAAAQTPASSSDAAAADEAKPALSVEQLVKLKQNPVSGLKQILFDANVNPNYPDSGKTQGIYSLQAVWPFSINEDYRLITYTILPQLSVPGPPGENTINGLGDTLINLFVTPKKAGALVWGAGPTILLPTRGDPALGSNRVGLGPAGLIYYEQKDWSAGLVLQNVWSLGGGSGVNKVNALGAQYLLNYNLPDGWSLYSNATITSNWTKESSERWTVPVGGGVGKLFFAGKQPISMSLQAFYNVVTPTGGPNWSLSFQLAFLFAAPQ
jgi:opacity protein-like surface antigen